MLRSLITLVFSAALVIGGLSAAAQDASKEAIIERLSKGVKAKQINVDELREAVKNRLSTETRSPSAAPEPIPDLAGELPSIGIEVYFDYDSATISPRSIPALIRIGQALRDPRLSKYRFLIAGHTDAAGGRMYNHALSEKRAGSVRDFLLRSFPLEPQKLSSIGFGYEQIKTPENPRAAVNRRVELINIGN